DEATRQMLRAREILESSAADPVKLAEIDINLGLVAFQQDDFAEARDRLHRGREVLAREQGEHHPKVAIASQDLCAIELEDGRLQAAESECAKARAIHANNE